LSISLPNGRLGLDNTVAGNTGKIFNIFFFSPSSAGNMGEGSFSNINFENLIVLLKVKLTKA
jgi:hypothetical protein